MATPSDDCPSVYNLAQLAHRLELPEDTMRRLLESRLKLDPDATYTGIIPEIENDDSHKLAQSYIGTFHAKGDIPFHEAKKWRTIGYMCGWKESARRMTDTATTYVLIVSLFVTVLFPAIILPPSFKDVEDTDKTSPIGISLVGERCIKMRS
jgi:hypothetical protein